MSTSLKSSRTTIFHASELGAEKNGRHRGPINDDLASTLTWTTPQNSLCARPTCLAAGRRSHHHDA